MNEIIKKIDNIKKQNSFLELDISKIDKNKKIISKDKEIKEAIDNKEQKKYTKIDMKQEDLRVTRTSDGIKIIRFCPSCGAENSPNEFVCVNCGFELKKSLA